jgi:hypothetical protein
MTVTNHGTVLTAAMLNANHIGSNIRFMIVDGGAETTTVIEAELRQIYHTSVNTTIDFGAGSADQETLSHDHAVLIDPQPPLSYVHGKPAEVRPK